MHRHNLQFPTKEAALREDVHALGSLVGEVLLDQGGEALLTLVEDDRVAAIGRREGEPEGTVTLDMRATDRPAQQASDLIRAFSKWFEVVNLAERVHRVRRRREYMNRSDRPQPGGIGDCMYRLKAAGLDGGQVLQLLRDVTIYPVFTAHPTESTRRTMLRKQQQIADLMIERLDPTLTPAERRSVWERIRMEVTSGWQTEVHPRERLTVADEREHVLFYLAEVIYRVVPALYEELAYWLETVFGLPPDAGNLPLLLRFGTWAGGDMDGNSEVHAKTIRETLHRQHQRIISAYYEECRALSGKLSQSASRVGVSRELEQRIAEYDILLPNSRQATLSRHDRMPYRAFLSQVAARLRTTYDGHPHHYESAGQFIRDIEIVAASLRANHGQHAGLFPVERLLCRARTFGFHLATLDVRQHASVHREVIRQGLALADWKRRKVDARRVVLREALARDRGPVGPFDAAGRRTLAVFEALIQGRNKYGDRATGDYVVSGTEGPDDVLSVLLLARWADITDRSVDEVPLDIAPVVETAAALEGAGEILRGLLTEDTYRRHLAARGNRQTVLVGYSDSSKECGIGRIDEGGHRRWH
ncbi:MAG: phosphoenolpyruvate carboxylase [Steroidobacteraceae bacterium]|nr:phosphoenolpyruvate carboxylase [Steroidobacteraceae bacterium]